MTRFWWVRHAPTGLSGALGWTDAPADLTDRAAVARLRAVLPAGAVVIASDLGRARATAAALDLPGPRLPDSADLREIHFGAWEGMGWDAIAAADPAAARSFWDDPGPAAAPGGESLDAVAARVARVLGALTAKDVVIVAHAGPIRAALTLAGVGVRASLGFRIDPLSLTRIDRVAGGWAIERVNHRP